MQYRIDSKTGNKLSILGFGCMRLPSTLGRLDQAKCNELFQKALDGGINYFDTAYIYPGSEAALGSFFQQTRQRDKVFLATKLPLIMCRRAKDFDKFLNTQLERLQTTVIDYYFMHMITGPEQWTKLCALGIEEWIAEKQEQGKIKQVGFSYHGKQDDFAAVLDAYDWDFCQIQYNYVNTAYQAGIAGLKRAYEKEMPVFIMEPLLGGKLVTDLPQEAVTVFKQANPELTPAGWALNWVWDQEEPTVVLSGMNAMEQLEENIVCANKAKPGMLSSEEKAAYAKVIEIFNASFKIPCTGCNYCMPCPKGVDIPACFAAYNNSYMLGRFAGTKQYITGMATATDNPAFASNCVACGTCETHCPQEIPISKNMKLVEKRLEPFWFKAGTKIAKKFMG